MEYEEIKNYWNNRASQHKSSIQATTDDVYLREIELQNIISTISTLNGIKKITDVGCGDGFTTIQVAKQFAEIQFNGFDYSEAMIDNANKLLQEQKLKNLSFFVNDITKTEEIGLSDLIYTSRCLINLNSDELQKTALNKIHQSLSENGYYLMIENFIDGHNEFNKLRLKFDLPEIKLREHNLFFEQENLLSFMKNKFELLKMENISSLYYIVSRILYSKICQNESKIPDYFDIHHQLGSKLPILGNYGPVKLFLFKKK